MNDGSDLSPTARKFILHWGEMGVRWGINRTMAQVHALLYLSEEPLHAERICEILDLSRSNVSVALRELQGWGIIKVAHLMGDRRDHFESMNDVFEMFRVIVKERERREVDPTLRLIHSCLEESSQGKGRDLFVRQRLESMKEFFELASSFSAQVERVPTSALIKVMRMGEKALRLLGIGGSLQH